MARPKSIKSPQRLNLSISKNGKTALRKLAYRRSKSMGAVVTDLAIAASNPAPTP